MRSAYEVDCGPCDVNGSATHPKRICSIRCWVGVGDWFLRFRLCRPAGPQFGQLLHDTWTNPGPLAVPGPPDVPGPLALEGEGAALAFVTDFLAKSRVSWLSVAEYSDMAKPVQKIILGASRDIPFNKLVLSQFDVRRLKTGVSVEDLAENVPACRPASTGSVPRLQGLAR